MTYHEIYWTIYAIGGLVWTLYVLWRMLPDYKMIYKRSRGLYKIMMVFGVIGIQLFSMIFWMFIVGYCAYDSLMRMEKTTIK